MRDELRHGIGIASGCPVLLRRVPQIIYPLAVRLSVVLITLNEEANLARTLASLAPLCTGTNTEIIIVDSGSTDQTAAIARQFGARFVTEAWQGFAAQKNSAIASAAGDWVLSLDADEELSAGAAAAILRVLHADATGDASIRASMQSISGFRLPRQNFFLGRWMRHGGYWPDPKLRLFRRGSAEFEPRAVHEDLQLRGAAADLAAHTHARKEDVALLHHAYPTLSSYLEHMNRYSSLGAEMATAKRPQGFSFANLVLRPLLTFMYNYVFRLGLLDGREGLLLHLNHALYVSWKYAKAWEISRSGGGDD